MLDKKSFREKLVKQLESFSFDFISLEWQKFYWFTLFVVIEENVAISESNRQLHLCLESLSSNYSALKTNFSRVFGQFESFYLEVIFNS